MKYYEEDKKQCSDKIFSHVSKRQSVINRFSRRFIYLYISQYSLPVRFDLCLCDSVSVCFVNDGANRIQVKMAWGGRAR